MSSSVERNTGFVPSSQHANDIVVPYNRLIIALDFGTTYSSVSWVPINANVPSDTTLRRDIRLISRYPEYPDHRANDGMHNEVPTEVIYPLDPHFRDRDALIRSRDDLEFQLAEGNDQDSDGDSVDNDLAQLNALRDEEEVPPVMDVPDEFSWGYDVHRRWGIASTHSNLNNQPLARFKLLLDDSPQTEAIRKLVNKTLRTLKRKGVVSGYQDVIADYLSYLLDHVKVQLRHYDDTWVREMVLCVPTIWKPRACREMQTCLAVAMRRAGFPGVNDNNTIERLFITSESENAAEFASSTELKSTQVYVHGRHIIFSLTRLGGGTVDYITYRVTCEEPVRLEHEVVPADGSLDGSSYINEDFREWLIQKLDDEDNLGEQYGSIIALVETLMSEHFEPRIKRNFDVLTKKPQRIEIPIPFLKEDHNSGFQRNHLVVPEYEE
ncbi:hypothetical protein BFJ72_g6852 [Fusarium proliferatum]|uniref:Uncharacterized protein n=1 Tax=Gibberella intermedia TaxID=948311 RepID=A0A420TCW8_GIBIN|nr:hypothetical protein BFJ72_g6852 [Fusarium proliferatum]